MQARLTTRPEQEVITAIRALDLEPIKLKLMDAEAGQGWTREHADRAEAAYKNYLTVLAKHPEKIEEVLLSREVDEFWHAHILHTMKYADDCEKVFGNFLHHNPQTTPRTPADAQKRSALMEKTRRLYQNEFGAGLAGANAWDGSATMKATTAYCEAGVRADKVAYCEATVRAAYCEAGVRADKAAYCEAGVRADKVAYCESTVRNARTTSKGGATDRNVAH